MTLNDVKDIRRDPGTTVAKTFESYLWLDDHEKAADKPLPVKIDMNHPLRYKGWRLFQSRFSSGTSETTFLQVNRDPGRLLLYVACTLLAAGLVIAFFQKPFLRALGRRLKRSNASPEKRFLAAMECVVHVNNRLRPALMNMLPCQKRTA